MWKKAAFFAIGFVVGVHYGYNGAVKTMTDNLVTEAEKGTAL